MQLLGMELPSIELGRVLAKLEAKNDHQQQNGLFHGGVISTAADVAMGFAAMTLVAPADMVVTGEMKVSFLNPGLGTHIESVGTVLKPGRRVNFCEAEVYAIEGNDRSLIAKASSSMIIISELDLQR
jgi:uncharacterized protein (TIGR00369 family)